MIKLFKMFRLEITWLEIFQILIFDILLKTPSMAFLLVNSDSPTPISMKKNPNTIGVGTNRFLDRVNNIPHTYQVLQLHISITADFPGSAQCLRRSPSVPPSPLHYLGQNLNWGNK